MGIGYARASAVDLPFADATFDFATGFMSFMDIPETGRVLAEAWRVLKPGGFLQFSISHPCFDTPHRRNLRANCRCDRTLRVGKRVQRILVRASVRLPQGAFRGLDRGLGGVSGHLSR